MLTKLLIGLALLLVSALVAMFWMTRDGSVVTPQGSGTVATASGQFEAFPLPDYADKALPGGYKSYLVEVEPGIKIHVLEAGSGIPIYLQHGNPTNGLLYRKVWQALPTDRMRLIMPTMVGLGFSSKIPASQHTLENHIRWMNTALRQLKLGGVVYVGQDWGGAVGLGALMRSPELLRGMVVLNTGWTAPKEKFELSRPHAIAATPIVGEILLENVVSLFDRLHETQGDPASIPPDVAALYGRPVIESGNRKGPLALMRMVPTGPDHPTSKPMAAIEHYAGTLNIPTEIVWGMRDPILARALPTMKAMYPTAHVTETQAGHFLQEEVPVEIADAITRVVAAVQAEQPALRAAAKPE
ncbi:alpha/beta fold hydrolase [Sandarakinorhabdus sp. AAP62]|uniref:alpha/beta fold hydrolase n=1 Tax=Sandarakinorhabdus sp. AAP62 TaxID=1248916 RepID=UPI00187D0C1E|nr:alpha/beta fold hydrolase [Sandarakinorhabdus sp. AAP62]